MKVSIKILYAFILLVILVTTFSFIYVRSVTEVEPSETINNEYIRKNITAEDFQTIVVKRGNWSLSVNQSDSFYVQVEAGDNIIDNYIKTRIVDGILVFDLDSALISDSYFKLKASVGMQSLNHLNLELSTDITLNNFDEENLDLNIKDGSVFLRDCRIENLNVSASGEGTVIQIDGSLGKTIFDLRDSSYVVINTADNISTGIRDLAVFIRLGEENNLNGLQILTSGKRKEMTKKTSACFSRLKWLMPYDTVMQIMNNDSLNYKPDEDLRSSDMGNLMKYKPFAIVESFMNKSENNRGLWKIQLLFSKGLLSDILLNYYFNDSNEIDALKSEFDANYGESSIRTLPEKARNDVWNNQMYEWKKSEQGTDGMYTTITYYQYNPENVLIKYSISAISVFERQLKSYKFDRPPEMRSFPHILESFTMLFEKPSR